MKTLVAISEFSRKYRLLFLLCVLILFILFSPLAELTGLGRLPLTLAFIVVLMAAVNAARDDAPNLRVPLVLGVLAILLQGTRIVAGSQLAQIAADLSAIILLVLTTGFILRRILVVRASNFDTLCGAAAVYLLLGLFWASTYDFLEGIAPGSFTGVAHESVNRWNDLIYFSLTTLTTLGYGDIMPVNPVARIWAALEAVSGVLYVAILVARLVAVYSRDHRFD